MKKYLLALLTVFGFAPAAQAVLIDQCVDIYDPATDSYYTECYLVETRVTTTETYNVQGSYDLYTETYGLIAPGVPVRGQLTIESWVDDYVGEEAQSITLNLTTDFTIESYFWEQFNYTNYNDPSQDLFTIREEILDSGYDYLFETTTDATGTYSSANPVTIWNVGLVGGQLTLRTLDNNDDGLPGAYYFNIAINETNTVDFQLQAVPLPAAVWLFGSGLIGLLGLARRRK